MRDIINMPLKAYLYKDQFWICAQGSLLYGFGSNMEEAFKNFEDTVDEQHVFKKKIFAYAYDDAMMLADKISLGICPKDIIDISLDTEKKFYTFDSKKGINRHIYHSISM